MKQITIRGVPVEISRALLAEKARRGTSLNQTLIDLLRQSLGLAGAQYDNGLSKLAGTWSKRELSAFERNSGAFEGIDEEVWK